MRIISMVILGFTIGYPSTSCLAGDLGGRARNVVSGQPIQSATVSVRVDDGVPAAQNTNADGKYLFPGLPSNGLAVIKGGCEGFRFGPVFVSLTSENTEADLWAMPAAHGVLTQEFVEWFDDQTARFENRSTGLLAAWTKVSYFGIPDFEKIELAQRSIESDPAASTVAAMRDYARADPMVIQAMHDDFGAYLKNPAGRFPSVGMDDVARSVTVDVAKLLLLENDDESRDRRFMTSLSKAWGKDVEDRVDQARLINTAFNQVFVSSWQAVKSFKNAETHYTLKLKGYRGIILEKGEIVGGMREVFYYEADRKLMVSAIGDYRGNPTWFTFEISPRNTKSFSGFWGNGNVIGRSQSEGTWTGVR